MKISHLLDLEHIRLDVSVESKEDVFLLLAQVAAQATGLPAADLLEALSKREALGSTGIRHGFALLHAALPGWIASLPA
ncbi:PTS sugar transporter subunit IIA [Paracoccus aestuariivivens]|uniref:PTS EIIA type-2 domain-containing protein n=1 Tax=Paracoccus aestuariivivens TaxID=1820333 RepID=A0A6L6JDM5_9RHOB|nr:PTS sugar transporter subunit IIA [Paracoccus aestuariivivens]MTH80263.1 hypothetical protein [Paracoccus aestuariivivens]